MSVLVLTGYNDGDFEAIGDRTTPGKRAWAARNGYDFECVRHYESGSHPSWQKLRLLEERLPHYQTIMWLDADTLITNPVVKVSSILGNTEASLVVSKDWGNCHDVDGPFHFSMGNFVIKSNSTSFSLIAAAKKHAEFQNSGLWEQSAIQQVARENPDLCEAISILPRRVLNSVPQDAQSSAPEPWQKGDFLAHLTGTSNSTRLAAIDNYNLESVEALVNASAYGISDWDLGVSIDKRHVSCIRDILLAKPWDDTLEIGCYNGCTSIAFVEAINKGTINHAHFCDINFNPSFRTAVSNVNDLAKISLYECQGHDLLNEHFSKSGLDLVVVDGNHTLPIVKKETQTIMRHRPECVIAHDINSQHVGFPECDGPPFLLNELQFGGYFCLLDSQDRPGEMTKRGLLIACKSYDSYQIALNAYRANCW